MIKKKLLMRIFYFTFFIYLHLQSNATNYFVSNTGNNTNTGLDIENTFLTIQFGINQAGAGDTVFVLAGTYFEQLSFNTEGESGQFLTLINYENDSVILDGSLVGNYTELVFLQNREYITIDGLHFTNHNGNYQPIINCYGSNQHIEIRNCHFYLTTSNESYAILIEGSGDSFVIENNLLHDLLGTNALGIAFFGTNPTTPLSNIKILNNQIENIEPAPSETIVVNGNVDGFEILFNTILNVNNIGIDMIGGENWVNENDSVNFARNGLCKNNFVQNAKSIYGGGYAAGIYVDGGKNILIENNTVTGADIGLEVGCENPGFNTENITVRNNILYKNEKSGLGFGGYNYPTTGKVSQCHFTGNTVFDNDSLNTGFGQLWIQYAENCVVENNIFYASTSSFVLNAYDWDITILGNKLNYNLYYNNSGDALFYFNEMEIIGFENYLIASNQDSNSMFSDPLFANESLADFHLSEFSLAIDAGNPAFVADSIEQDLDGELRIQNLHIDIGADEFFAKLPSFLASIPDVNQSLFVPNPTERFVTILNHATIRQIILFNVQGEQFIIEAMNNENKFDLSALFSGIYFAQYETEHKWFSTKIMIL